MSYRNILWEQWWSSHDDTRNLRCVQEEGRQFYEVTDLDDNVLIGFRFYDEAVEWLTQESFHLDLSEEDTHPTKPKRRWTPQQKKQISYARDRHSMSTGQGASRRMQQVLPKLRRRQYRRRLKEYVRREMNTLFREVSDQSLRSIRAERKPEFTRSVRLDRALAEKQHRRAAANPTPPRRTDIDFDSGDSSPDLGASSDTGQGKTPRRTRMRGDI